MSDSKSDQILDWLEAGQARGASHVIVACGADGLDHPVYVPPTQDARETAMKLDLIENTHVREVYRLDLSWRAQISARRVRNY